MSTDRHRHRRPRSRSTARRCPTRSTTCVERVVVDDNLRLPGDVRAHVARSARPTRPLGRSRTIGVKLGDRSTVSVDEHGTRGADRGRGHLARGRDRQRPARTWWSAATTSRTGSTAAARRAAGPTRRTPRSSADDRGRGGLDGDGRRPDVVARVHRAGRADSDWDFLSRAPARSATTSASSDGELKFRKPPTRATAGAGRSATPARPDRLRRQPALVPAARERASTRSSVVRGARLGREDEAGGHRHARAATRRRRRSALQHSAAAGALGAKTFVRQRPARSPPRTRRRTRRQGPGREHRLRPSPRPRAWSIGDPSLKAGAVGQASRASARRSTASTSLTLDAARLDAYGYRTHFVVSGRQDRSLLGLVSGGRRRRQSGVRPAPSTAPCPRSSRRSRTTRTTSARVKVKFPWLDDAVSSDWARVVFPGAGKRPRVAFMPEVDDEVLVCFEQGDFRRPYVLGGLFNGVDTPKDADSSSTRPAARSACARFTTRVGPLAEVHRQRQRQGREALDGRRPDRVARARRGRPHDHDLVVGRHHDQVGRRRQGQHQGRHVDDARGDVEPRAEGADREDQRRRPGRDQVVRPAHAPGDAGDAQGRRARRASSRAGSCRSRAAS